MPESKKLQAYQDALSRLSLEKQIEKMNAVQSPKTIRRVLSADAPPQLIERFGHRIFEAELAPDEEEIIPFSTYEKGRVLAIQNMVELATKTLSESPYSTPKTHVEDEGLLMAEVLLHHPKSENLGVKFLTNMHEEGIEKPKPSMALLEYYYGKNEIFPGNILAHQLLTDKDIKGEDQHYIIALKELYSGDMDQGAALMEQLAATGHYRALQHLAKYYGKEGDADKLEAVLLKKIQHGEVGMYIDLSQLYVEKRQFQKAVDAARAATKVNRMDGYEMLVKIYTEHLDCIPEAYDIAIESLNQGYYEPAMILAYFCYAHGQEPFTEDLINEVKSKNKNAIDPTIPNKPFLILMERAITSGRLHEIPHIAEAGNCDEEDLNYFYMVGELFHNNMDAALKRFEIILKKEGDRKKISVLKSYITQKDQRSIELYMLGHVCPDLMKMGLVTLANKLIRRKTS